MPRLYSDFRRRLSIVDWTAHSQQYLERICEHLGSSTLPPLGRENPTEVTGAEQRIDSGTVRLLGRLTSVDRLFLDQLCADGALARRSKADLDEEFETTATRLEFRLGR
jgi:hypothetical protein